MEVVGEPWSEYRGRKLRSVKLANYICPVCSCMFTAVMANVRSLHTTKCRACAQKNRGALFSQKARDSFITKAVEVHGDVYDYSDVEYTTVHAPVSIRCKIHNYTFRQRPSNHLSGQGCPKCASTGNLKYEFSRPGTLYLVHFPEHNMWKLGITTRELHTRLSGEGMEYTVVNTVKFTYAAEAYIVEQFLLRKVYASTLVDSSVKSPLRSTGNTELLHEEPMDIIDNVIFAVIETHNTLIERYKRYKESHEKTSEHS